jgi:streptomycin 6-kinase
MVHGLVIPQTFQQRIASVWGESGRAWLDRLPTLISRCVARWHLSIQGRAPVLSYNFAAFVVTADGTEAVLKIGVPNPELLTEIEALRALQGRPVVELLEGDRELGALLLRRLVPGTPLSAMRSDEEGAVIGARLIGALPTPEPAEHAFPTVAGWALAFDRLRMRLDGGTGPLPARLVEKAERLFRELEGSCPRSMLLHGDLHHDNILSDARNGWVAIDPKGVIGDPTYEAARFQHNPIPGFLSMERPRAVAERRVEILASILGEERSRLLAWAFFDAMLAACWSLEDGGDWGYHLSCAELFDGMVA